MGSLYNPRIAVHAATFCAGAQVVLSVDASETNVRLLVPVTAWLTAEAGRTAGIKFASRKPKRECLRADDDGAIHRPVEKHPSVEQPCRRSTSPGSVRSSAQTDSRFYRARASGADQAGALAGRTPARESSGFPGGLPASGIPG